MNNKPMSKLTVKCKNIFRNHINQELVAILLQSMFFFQCWRRPCQLFDNLLRSKKHRPFFLDSYSYIFRIPSLLLDLLDGARVGHFDEAGRLLRFSYKTKKKKNNTRRTWNLKTMHENFDTSVYLHKLVRFSTEDVIEPWIIRVWFTYLGITLMSSAVTLTRKKLCLLLPFQLA